MHDTMIYALTGDDGVAVYVGRTIDPLDSRLRGHFYAKSAVGDWLRANETRARIVPLEVIRYASGIRPGARERFWINKLRSDGRVLLNKWPFQRRMESALAAIEAERASPTQPESAVA